MREYHSGIPWQTDWRREAQLNTPDPFCRHERSEGAEDQHNRAPPIQSDRVQPWCPCLWILATLSFHFSEYSYFPKSSSIARAMFGWGSDGPNTNLAETIRVRSIDSSPALMLILLFLSYSPYQQMLRRNEAQIITAARPLSETNVASLPPRRSASVKIESPSVTAATKRAKENASAVSEAHQSTDSSGESDDDVPFSKSVPVYSCGGEADLSPTKSKL